MVMAVSTFSVLAGGNSPCGSLAARTEPVLALAMRYADAGTAGSGPSVVRVAHDNASTGQLRPAHLVPRHRLGAVHERADPA